MFCVGFFGEEAETNSKTLRFNFFSTVYIAQGTALRIIEKNLKKKTYLFAVHLKLTQHCESTTLNV